MGTPRARTVVAIAPVGDARASAKDDSRPHRLGLSNTRFSRGGSHDREPHTTRGEPGARARVSSNASHRGDCTELSWKPRHLWRAPRSVRMGPRGAHQNTLKNCHGPGWRPRSPKQITLTHESAIKREKQTLGGEPFRFCPGGRALPLTFFPPEERKVSAGDVFADALRAGGQRTHARHSRCRREAWSRHPHPVATAATAASAAVVAAAATPRATIPRRPATRPEADPAGAVATRAATGPTGRGTDDWPRRPESRRRRRRRR